MKNVIRTIQSHCNANLHKQSYIGVASWEASDITEDWKAEEATKDVFIIDYKEGDEDLTLDELINR